MEIRKHVPRLTAAAALVACAGVVTAAAPARSTDAPKSTSSPTIEGPAANPFVGDTLSAGNGGWTGSPTKFTYQWDRCNPTGDRQGCVAIAGATSKSYDVKADDVDHKLHVRVTAANADGSATADSKTTGVVSANKAPTNKTRPSITGTADVGSTLTADPGTWAGATSFRYQWQLCDQTGAKCTAIAGATGKTYNVRSGDKDNTLRVEVTGRNKFGTAASTSDRSPVVGAGGGGTTTTSPGPAGCAVAADAVKLPARLLIDKWTFTPRSVGRGAGSFTARIHITETGRSCSVSGAKLWSTAIPYNQTTTEQGTTGADGWGTLSFSLKGGFPANPGRQQILAMLVRATQPGGSVLAGVSTRRVLSQRVG
jgi:hypothetical protein